MLIKQVCNSIGAGALALFTLQAAALVPARDMNPVVLMHGLPAIPDTTDVKAGDHRFGISADLSSVAVIDEDEDETLIFDGETRRVALRYEWGFTDRAVIGIEIPWIKHSGGTLDSFLDDYHDALGLPNGDRPHLPENKIRFQYSHNGVNELNFRDHAEGLGNVSIFGSFPMIAYPEANSSLGIQINLPTGDPDKLTGSDGASVALWLHETTQVDELWQAWYTLGGIWMDDGEVLGARQESGAGFLNLGFSRLVGASSSLHLQIDAHSKLYADSDMKLLGDSVQLTVGTTTRFSGGWNLTVNLTEDIDTEASPDVVFNFALTKTFR